MAYEKYSRSFVYRFWARTKRNRFQRTPCWNWTGGKTKQGYGRVVINHKQVYAHRVSYEMKYGNIPQGMFVCHKCDNPACVNPYHLFLGTPADNSADRNRKGHLRKSRFTLTQMEYMRSEYNRGVSQATIAREMGISQTHVHAIIHGEIAAKDGK